MFQRTNRDGYCTQLEAKKQALEYWIQNQRDTLQDINNMLCDVEASRKIINNIEALSPVLTTEEGKEAKAAKRN